MTTNQPDEKPLLREPDVFPDSAVLANVLGDSLPVYEELMAALTGAGFGLTPEWRYYNDGKAWLCKVCHKKKTIFWLSVWDRYFKIAFYFTEKTGAGIADLDIAEPVKSDFYKHKPIGKLLPLLVNVSSSDQVPDILRVADYKMRQK
ncbi:DUF3788 family protein [Gaoshiqia sediminis]|uniref:DUF3788 domain-containing protein n=1 Tax=Gaoshiqia sediminis TaxID=2986998 RepID=A0AA42CA38_9BACT|nr:DUF3788 family protein [Gaoshiqia sediminis]MCW0482975.1 DUF3788 domain-containing protein [Gaoshiqia sediminis]